MIKVGIYEVSRKYVVLFMHNKRYLPLTGLLTLLQWTIQLARRATENAWPGKWRTKSTNQKLECLPKICAAYSMCLSLLVFTQLFSKVAQSEERHDKAARKQNLTRNSHSRSFKVMPCVLGSLKSWRRTAYRYIIMLASSLKFPRK